MSSPEEWFVQLPRVTRSWLVLALLSTFGVALKLVSGYKLVYIPELIVEKFEIWRLITPFIFFGPLGFPFVMNLFFLVRYSGALEADPYKTTPGAAVGSTADYAFCLLFCGFFQLIIGYLMGMFILGPSLVFSLLYLWSRRHPDDPISFWGFAFKGIHLPWVLTAFGILIGNNPANDLIGIAVGHLYFFIVAVLPLKLGRDILKTPEIFIRLVDIITGEMTMIPQQQGRSRGSVAAPPPRYWVGEGRRLGGAHED